MAGRPRRWASAGACAATVAVASLCYAGGGLGAAVSRRFDFGAVLTGALSIEAGGADYATRPGVGYPWLVEGRIVEPWRETTLSAKAYDEKRDYSWTVTDAAGAAWTASGVEVSRTFTALGQYRPRHGRRVVDGRQAGPRGDVLRRGDRLADADAAALGRVLDDGQLAERERAPVAAGRGLVGLDARREW